MNMAKRNLSKKQLAAIHAKGGNIKQHGMYSASDYSYLTNRGYTDKEIKTIWDRDLSIGKTPLIHKKAPDIVGQLTSPPITRNNKRYRVTTEHGVRQTVYAPDMATVRKQMNDALPGVKLRRIEEQ